MAAAAIDDEALRRRGLMRLAGAPPSSSRQQFVPLMTPGSPGDDALQHVGEIGLRIEFVEFYGVENRAQDRPALGAAFAAR
ncbi:hypothetical protein ACVWW1_008834 [Bradyrhizobium sp. JR3.5]